MNEQNIVGLPTWILGGFSAAIFVAALAFPAAALPLLMASTVLDRYRFDAAGVGLRLEHFVFIGVALAWWLRVRPNRAQLHFARADGLLGAYLGLTLIASWSAAPRPGESLKFLALMTFGVVLYWLVRALAGATARAFTRGVWWWVLIGSAACGFGIIAWLVFPFGINLGVQTYVLQGFATLSPYGTLWDGNTYGIFAMALALLLMTLLLNSPRSTAPRVWLGLGVVVALVAVALSLTRAAWIGLGVGLLLIGLTSLRRRWVLALGSAAALLVVLALVFNSARAGANPSGGSWERLLTSKSVGFRLDSYQRAVTAWLQNPLLGNGANVFAQTYTDHAGQRGWISNFFLMTLHDTGVVGFILLMAWLAAVGWDARRVLRAAPASPERTLLLALCIAYLALLVTYQATTQFWLGWNWVYLGLIRAGTIVSTNSHEFFS